MFRFGWGQSFKKPALKEWEGLSSMLTFHPGQDLVMGNVGRKTSQAKGISQVAGLRWVRGWHTEKPEWARATGTDGCCACGALTPMKRDCYFIHDSVRSLRRVCKMKVIRLHLCFKRLF